MDEDDYESIVAQLKQSTFDMDVPAASRVPSRTATPCRQTKLKDLLSRIDTKFPEINNTKSTLLGLNSVVRYKNLLEMIEKTGCLRDCSPGERDELISTVLGQSSSSSKWMSPGRIGQAELYDALEKVLNELKAFTPYSLPFCTKVNKKEVPDYFDIIKRPMDLGTMSRKLKSMLYNNKREFMADLQRIYNNCFTYNTDPNSLLRMHVTMLKEKWTKLMAEVPDIQIRVTSAAVGGGGGISERSQSQMSLDSSDHTEHSLSSTRNPANSQNIDPTTTTPLIELEAPPRVQSVSSPICSMDARTSLGMGFYHRSRTRPSTRPASQRHPSQFRPELACPNQIIPDSIAAIPLSKQQKESNPAQFDVSRVDELLQNLEYWRRLWASRHTPPSNSSSRILDNNIEQSQMDQGPTIAKISYQSPDFGSDCKVIREKETNQVLGLLLAHEGFESVRSDALTLIMDLFLDKFSSLATGLNRAFSSNHHDKPNILLIRESLQLDCRALSNYTQTFLSHRRKCLEHAWEVVEEARRDAARFRSSEEDVDVEAVDDQQDLGGDDDLLDLDDESLLLGEDELPLTVNDLDSQPATINIAALSSTPIVSLTASDILMVPKRALPIPVQQPTLKRPHEED